jgi:lysophospholipase L1-like esterase
MRGPRRALLAGLAVSFLALAASGCGSGGGDETTGPNNGSAIASLGDSVAAGEGNPAPNGRRWENVACHRSPVAGQTIASRKAQKKNPELGFFDYACSGASIPKGMLGPYKGIEPAPLQPARSQIDQLKDAAAVTDSSGGLAAVLISIGANDVGFSKVFKFCALVKHCWNQHFNPDFPYAEAAARFPTLQEYVRDRIADLPASYNDLANALEPLVPASRVVIVDYFDPTTGAGGAPCTMLFGGVTPDESRWAQEHMLRPLNATIDAAAKEHGWNAVTGVAERFRGHGLCAPGSQRWVLTLGEGLSGHALPLRGGAGYLAIRDVIESTAGTLHPNAEGQRQIAHLIDPVLTRVLNQ